MVPVFSACLLLFLLHFLHTPSPWQPLHELSGGRNFGWGSVAKWMSQQRCEDWRQTPGPRFALIARGTASVGVLGWFALRPQWHHVGPVEVPMEAPVVLWGAQPSPLSPHFAHRAIWLTLCPAEDPWMGPWVWHSPVPVPLRSLYVV